MQCPKCGFEQPVSEECMACGVIFAKLPADLRPPELQASKALAVRPPVRPPVPPIPLPTAAAVLPSAAPPAPQPPAAKPPPPRQLPRPPAGDRRFENKYGLPDVYDGPPPPPFGPAAGVAADAAPVGFRPPAGPIGKSGRAVVELSVFGITAEAVRTFFRNLIPFVAISLFALAPGAVIVYLATTSSLAIEELADLRRVLVLLAVSAIASLVGTAVATGGITFGVALHLDGREVPIERCLGFGLRTLLPVAAVAILQSLIVGFGLLLCVIPGVIFLTVYAVAIPALVQERCGVMESLRRSNELTDGHRLTIFGLFFLLGVARFGGDQLLLAAFGGAAEATDYLIASLLLDIAFTGLQATAIALIYYRLRELRDRSSMHAMAVEIAGH